MYTLSTMLTYGQCTQCVQIYLTRVHYYIVYMYIMFTYKQCTHTDIVNNVHNMICGHDY